MRVFLSYIYKIKLWLVIVITEILMMTGILMLNDVPSTEIIYGICLLLFIVFIAVVYDYYGYYHKYKYLEIIEKNIELLADTLPEAKDCIEQKYQQLIKKMACYYNGVIDKNSKMFKDMDEYYTMWDMYN